MSLVSKRKRHLDRSALNVIRLVTASYFMAVALGLIGGVDPSRMFIFIPDENVASLVGSAVLFFASFTLLCGMFLRSTALFLAIFVLSSSVLQNFLDYQTGSTEAFWRDLVLVCSVLLNYGVLSPREIRGAAMVTRRYQVRQISAGDWVAPRRVTTDASENTEVPARIPHVPLTRTADAALSGFEDQTMPGALNDGRKSNIFQLPSTTRSALDEFTPEADITVDEAMDKPSKSPQKRFAALAAESRSAKRDTSPARDIIDLDEDESFNIFAEDEDGELVMFKMTGSSKS